MGMYHSTYFAYGIHIPDITHAWAESERADKALNAIKDRCPDVGHLSAGNYDQDMFFLVTTCHEVSLGKFENVTPDTATPEQLADWSQQLTAAASALGYDNTTVPGWIVVPDVS